MLFYDAINAKTRFMGRSTGAINSQHKETAKEIHSNLDHRSVLSQQLGDDSTISAGVVVQYAAGGCW